MSTRAIQAVLFDLDGTFADTAPDLADALNKTLLAHNAEPLPFDAIRPVVSHGGKALIELGFNINEKDTRFEGLRRELLNYYEQDLVKHTQVFPGLLECVAELVTQRIKWGIVTNKPAWLTNPLVESLMLAHSPCCVVSGDTVQERKPHPAPLLHACQLCNVDETNTIYVGDAERDIIAGRRAGMYTVIARYGYLSQTDQPDTWQADAQIHHPHELMPLVNQLNGLPPRQTNYAN
jgi:phosphoglycolate phosphatase